MKQVYLIHNMNYAENLRCYVSVKLDTFVDIFLDFMHSECTKNPGKETVCSICLQYKSWNSLCFLRAEVQNKLHKDQDYPCEVVGSWNTWYGEQDQAGEHECCREQNTGMKT